tara:strand:- start:286 stop:561 length:276 start_codon:yes stop_codon:yes gene_type:complete
VTSWVLKGSVVPFDHNLHIFHRLILLNLVNFDSWHLLLVYREDCQDVSIIGELDKSMDSILQDDLEPLLQLLAFTLQTPHNDLFVVFFAVS